MARKKEKRMTKKFLAVAIALASMFATQQAFAKSSHNKNSMASKKHHKKHVKKASAAPMFSGVRS